MRIGIEAQRLFRPKKHGMDIVALELIRNLQRIDKKNQYFIFVKPDQDDDVVCETANFHIVRIGGGPYPYWEQILLPKEIRKYNLDLLHCTSNTAPLNVHVPLIVTLHDIIFLEQWNFTKGSTYQIAGNLYRRWNVPRMVKKAKQLITVSQNEKTNIDRHFNFTPEKVVAIHNGVGTQFQKISDPAALARVKAKYHLPDRYVFYLGNTDPRKNLHGVLRALSILRKNNRLDFRLQMLDIEHSFLQKAAGEIGDPEVMDYIGLCGYVPEADLPVIYSMAEIFLFPSLREGFGIPILEAMNTQVPVVTSNSSSMPEVAGDAALLIDPKDPEEIATAIDRLRNDVDLRNDLIRRGLKRAQQFSWQGVAERYLQTYHQVKNNL
jgi:glycosyltransferase involved in cell wall biosynthesis